MAKIQQKKSVDINGLTLGSPCKVLAELVRQYFDAHPETCNDEVAMLIKAALTRHDRMSIRSFLPGDRVAITNSGGGIVEGSIVEKCPLVVNGWRVRYKHGAGDVVDSFPDYRLIVPAIPAVLEGDRHGWQRKIFDRRSCSCPWQERAIVCNEIGASNNC